MARGIAERSAGRKGMMFVPGGTFALGSERHYPEEAPVREETVEPFWIDEHPVTNLEFLRFVKATGHVTWAERVTLVLAPSSYTSRALPRPEIAASIAGISTFS